MYKYPSELVYAAADSIAAGWCQGDYSDAEGNLCILGALDKAAGSKPGWCPKTMYGSAKRRRLAKSYWEARRVLSTRLGGCIATYNDRSYATQEDIVLVLKRTAYALERMGR